MGAAASSSYSSSPVFSPKTYDVFISFRGEDTRTNFTSHLYTALCQKSIRTYIDYELRRGDEISQALIQAIQGSSISVVVFSENYASSKWCLDELTQILQCRKDQGQFVIPVFYNVNPSDVRKQNGTYKKAFTKHEQDIHNHDKVNKWKDALFYTTNLAGWDSGTMRDESELIENIVNDVLQKLDHRYPNVLKGLVGIDENCQYIELLLQNAPVIGIWGMGGIGKTTMAKIVFAKLCSQFESCCFLENIREESEKHGLSYIRDKLILELLKEENLHSGTFKVIGSTFVMRRLSCRKVLIVLDDVNNSEQLEYLARGCDCLGSGSRVIITTRDKHVLIGRVNGIHDAKALSDHESLKLFCFKAFHKDCPDIGYEELSEGAIAYAKGIPLALTVLGSFLHFKTKEEWDSALRKLKRTPNEDIQKVLKLSYDDLNYEEKEIFLDIACFLKGEAKEHLINLLESYGFHATIGIRALLDKGLVTMDEMGKKVWMHDLIQEMSWEIVRQECIKEPGRRSRLWDPKEIYDVLKNNQGTEVVEGILLDVSRIKDLHLTIDTFKKMTNIRFLKFYSSRNSLSCHVHLPTGLEWFSNKTRYFEWGGYPLKSLSSTFCTENLVELNMPGSHVQTLWEGVQDFKNLKRIDFSFCKELRELPDFSKAHNLEYVKLLYCESLCYVHPSILSLHSLVALDLRLCKSLKSLQSETHLRSLRELTVKSDSLKEFSLSSEELTNLFLRSTRLEKLHSSIGRLSKLKTLSLNCPKLKNVPIKELCCLRSLEELLIWNHTFDKLELHLLFEALCSLRELLFLDCYNLIELPNNINQLSRLQVFSLKGCKNLQCLPELPLSVEELDVTGCISLSINCSSGKEFSILSNKLGIIDPSLYSSSIGHLTNLKKLYLSGSNLGNLPITEICCFRSLVNLCLRECRHAVDAPKLHILFDTLRSLQKLELEECCNIIELPNNIRYLSELEHLSLNGFTRLRSLPELPQSIRKLIISNCTLLETIFTSTISRLLWKDGDRILSFHNCVKLDERSLRAIRKCEKFLLKRAVHNRQEVIVSYPGNWVPRWFRHNGTTKDSVAIELSLSFDNLLGFIFCSIIGQFNSKSKYPVSLICECFFEDGELLGNFGISDLSYVKFSSSNNVLLGCVPWFSKSILETLKRSRGNDEGTTKVSFRFRFGNRIMKGCGVYPIYASAYQNVDQQRKLELELCKGSKRRRDIDELELEPSEIGAAVRSCDEKEALPQCKKLKLELPIDELEAQLMRINIS